ncbi:hypothetical protein CDD83_5152 [Cordyceps sp. RAO-2017]|nr:hypothetical protein CDD83_5152 [Cordyceps sp. RAO-2017]
MVKAAVDSLCKDLGDDLNGRNRTEALGRNNKQIVLLAPEFPPLPAEELLQIVNGLNDCMARYTNANPQLIGTALIAPPTALVGKDKGSYPGRSYVKDGLNSFRRAIRELHLKAVMLQSNYDSIYLGDEIFSPYFALAEELDVPVFIHPSGRAVGSAAMTRHRLSLYTGYLNDQRTALLDIVMSGTYEKFPKLKIIATHLGGGILTSLGRFGVLSSGSPQDTLYVDKGGHERRLRNSIEYYLKKIYYDCNDAKKVDIEHAVSVVGEDRLLTGTDFPFNNDTFTRGVLAQLDHSVARKIAFTTADRLFD